MARLQQGAYQAPVHLPDRFACRRALTAASVPVLFLSY
jgi:hypothetical protein